MHASPWQKCAYFGAVILVVSRYAIPEPLFGMPLALSPILFRAAHGGHFSQIQPYFGSNYDWVLAVSVEFLLASTTLCAPILAFLARINPAQRPSFVARALGVCVLLLAGLLPFYCAVVQLYAFADVPLRQLCAGLSIAYLAGVGLLTLLAWDRRRELHGILLIGALPVGLTVAMACIISLQIASLPGPLGAGILLNVTLETGGSILLALGWLMWWRAVNRISVDAASANK